MLLPTMTLDEIYKAIYDDWTFVMLKMGVAAKDFRRTAIKQRKNPLKRKYTYRNYKSNIVYSLYLVAHTRSQWDNPMIVVATTYTHDGGTTVVMADYINKELSLIDTHFMSRFRERYLQDESLTMQESIDFFLWNFDTLSPSRDVMRLDDALLAHNEGSEYFALVSSLGVFYCEKIPDNPKVIIYRTYLSMEMLKRSQNHKVAINYLWAYFKDYMNRNPKEAAKIDAMLDDFVAGAEKNNWPYDKFISESAKLMDKYPLYVL